MSDLTMDRVWLSKDCTAEELKTILANSQIQT